MAAPTIGVTFRNLRWRIARHFRDHINGTASGGSSTTLTDTGDIDRFPTSPQYFLGAELTWFDTDVAGTYTQHITTHAKSGGTVTLTVPTMAATPASGDVYEIHLIGGKGFEKSQYDDAINAAIDSIADSYWTDTNNIYFGIQRIGNPDGGQPRHEYPMPSGFNFITAVEMLGSPPRAYHPVAYLETYRALGDDNARNMLAQGFKVWETGWYGYVSVGMNKVGSPTDNLTVAIQGDSSGTPDGSTLTYGTSDTVDGSTLDEEIRYVVFRFTPPVFLTANTQYHLVLDRSGAADSSNYYRVTEDTDGIYGYGAMSVHNNTSWSAVSGSDLGFAVFANSSLWNPLRYGREWEYVRVGSDFIRIYNLGYEGTPVRIVGGAAIAEASTETTNVPIRPEYIEAFAVQSLLADVSSLNVSEENARRLLSWSQHIQSRPRPFRHLPKNSVQVYA